MLTVCQGIKWYYIASIYLTFTATLLGQVTLTNPILQMRKLRYREVK